MCERLRLAKEGFGTDSPRVGAIKAEDVGLFTVWGAEVKLDDSVSKPSANTREILCASKTI